MAQFQTPGSNPSEALNDVARLLPNYLPEPLAVLGTMVAGWLIFVVICAAGGGPDDETHGEYCRVCDWRQPIGPADLLWSCQRCRAFNLSMGPQAYKR